MNVIDAYPQAPFAVAYCELYLDDEAWAMLRQATPSEIEEMLRECAADPETNPSPKRAEILSHMQTPDFHRYLMAKLGMQ